MKVNYKRELEDAARNMILVRKPHTLIRMILRTIVRKVKVEHAGILLYEKNRDSYIVTVTRGQIGTKMPAGFIRLDPQSPIIRFFHQKDYLALFEAGALSVGRLNYLLQKKELFQSDPEVEKLLLAIKFQMKSFDAVVSVPCYFQDDLLGVLMLGEKNNGKKAFNDEEIQFFIALANDVAMALRNAFLFQDLQLEIETNKSMFFETTLALAAAIDAKDHYTRGHTNRVTEYSLAIAKWMAAEGKGRSDAKFFDDLHIAGLLHDVGKIGVPEAILNKNGPLTEEERTKINAHSLIGASILEPIKNLGSVIQGVKYHHERFDGKGYPEGLSGENIPYMARIISVADSFDAMTSDRPYRKAFSRDYAMAELVKCRNTQFHAEVVDSTKWLFEKGMI